MSNVSYEQMVDGDLGTDPAVAEEAARIFALLGSPSRLRLLAWLLTGERRVGDLARETGLTESATSHALGLMRAHRVVAVRREGRDRWYRLADAHVRVLVTAGLAHSTHQIDTSKRRETS